MTPADAHMEPLYGSRAVRAAMGGFAVLLLNSGCRGLRCHDMPVMRAAAEDDVQSEHRQSEAGKASAEHDNPVLK